MFGGEDGEVQSFVVLWMCNLNPLAPGVISYQIKSNVFVSHVA